MKETIILLMCLIFCLSCKNADDLPSSKEQDDVTTVINDDETATDDLQSTEDIEDQEKNENTTKNYWRSSEFEDCMGFTGCAVRIKLKPQTDERYLATEDPEMIALVSKYNLTLYQTYPGKEKSTPDLLLYYTLKTNDCMSRENWEKAVNEFLSTGKFEDEVYEYEIAYFT